MLFTESQRGKLLEALEALALASSLLDAVGEAGEFVSTLLDPETEAELRGEL
jgi:hypothetical protein